MGLVFVLLLGEIDLSAGFASGVCAAVLAVTSTRHGLALVGRASLAASPPARVIGLVIGLLVAKVGIPSFVVTLAAFLGVPGRAAAHHRRGRDHPDPGRHASSAIDEQEPADLARLGALPAVVGL